MFLLMTYDVEAKRTPKFKKLLGKYLQHQQYSVFTGDITQAEYLRLQRELNKLMIHGDRVTEVQAKNRKNVDVFHLVINESGKGNVSRITDDSHRSDYGVL